MEAALVASAALLGLAGLPHCAGMCAGPCAALLGPQRGAAPWAFQAARLASYSLAGAAAASSVALLAGWAQVAPWMRPLWTLLQLAMLGLGLWLLWFGRQPAWMQSWGRSPLPSPRDAEAADAVAAGAVPPPAQGWVAQAVATHPLPWPTHAAAGGVPVHGRATRSAPSAARPRPVLQAGLAGAMWVAWPCGLLQSALLVASLSGSAWGGGAVMGAFAVTSSAGLVLGPWAWSRWMSRAGADRPRIERRLVRLGGALVAAAALWALGHGLWPQVAAFCGLG